LAFAFNLERQTDNTCREKLSKARGLHQTSIESDRIAKMIFDKQLAALGQL
jgi:hypothetical protein